MASQGPTSCGTGADDATIGTITWLNPTRITASDDSRATGTGTIGTVTHYLKGTNFGFTIPSGATIDGIVVEWERSDSLARSASPCLDNEIKIVKGGTIGATNKADLVTAWGTTDAYAVYGSSSDLWGETWTDTDINGSTFGSVLSCQSSVVGGTYLGQVDHCRITVYYTAASGVKSSQTLSMMGVG